MTNHSLHPQALRTVDSSPYEPYPNLVYFDRNHVHRPRSWEDAYENIQDAEGLARLKTLFPTVLFVYGSLMMPSVVLRVLDPHPTDVKEAKLASRMCRATPTHHKRLASRGPPFPAVIEEGGETDDLEDFLIFGLSAADIGALDRFESGQFCREVELELRLLHSDLPVRLYADTYIWAGSRDRLVETSEKAWSLDEFLLSQAHYDLVPQDTLGLEAPPPFLTSLGVLY